MPKHKHKNLANLGSWSNFKGKIVKTQTKKNKKNVRPNNQC